jgi:ornithine--oxo-acid transaminase
MIENSARLGSYFLERLAELPGDKVKEVRGRGLMLAIELEPGAGPARQHVLALKERGVLAKDTHGSKIRISPPLVITRAEVDWVVEQLQAVLV